MAKKKEVTDVLGVDAVRTFTKKERPECVATIAVLGDALDAFIKNPSEKSYIALLNKIKIIDRKINNEDLSKLFFQLYTAPKNIYEFKPLCLKILGQLDSAIPFNSKIFKDFIREKSRIFDQLEQAEFAFETRLNRLIAPIVKLGMFVFSAKDRKEPLKFLQAQTGNTIIEMKKLIKHYPAYKKTIKKIMDILQTFAEIVPELFDLKTAYKLYLNEVIRPIIKAIPQDALDKMELDKLAKQAEILNTVIRSKEFREYI